MPAIQFSGLASGLDTDAIVNAVLGVERIPNQRLQAQNQNLRAQKEIVNRLSSALSDFSTKAKALATPEEFLSFKATSSDESVAKLAASGDAARGTYELKVSQLASSQRNYSKAYADSNTSIAAADTTLDITIGDTTTSVNVAAGTTLSQLVDEINGSGADVTAGIFSGTDGYRLQIVGNKSGADNAITFDAGALGSELELSLNQTQNAQNAIATLDGFAVESSTNVIGDALPGVSLELFETNTSGVQLRIEPESSAVKEKVQGFVDSYNQIVGIINEQVGEGKGESTLNGDATVRMIESRLRNVISSAIPGLNDAQGFSLALSQIGIETQRDGRLSLNQGDFDKALSKDFEGTARYFSGNPAGDVQGISGLVMQTVKDLTEGEHSLLSSRQSGIDQRIRNNEDRIAAHDRYLESYEAQLRAQYTALEQTMSMLKSQGNYLAQFMR